MKFRTSSLSTAVIIFGALAISSHPAAQNVNSEIVSFDAPGADTTAGSGNGTFASGVNEAGAIAGRFTDANHVSHGFLRSPDGVFNAFDAPGASTTPGSGGGTFPSSINNAGAITGRYADAHNVNHGFLRSPEGKLITFDVPGAGTNAGSGGGTFPNSINDAGAITGRYSDAHNVNHGFLRSSEGKLITFDVRGAGTNAGSGGGTFPASIGGRGAITGNYVDESNARHGFVSLEARQ